MKISIDHGGSLRLLRVPQMRSIQARPIIHMYKTRKFSNVVASYSTGMYVCIRNRIRIYIIPTRMCYTLCEGFT